MLIHLAYSYFTEKLQFMLVYAQLPLGLKVGPTFITNAFEWEPPVWDYWA